MRPRRVAPPLLALAAIVACSHDSGTAPAVPTRLAQAQAVAATATVGTLLAAAPAIAITDANGAFVAGVPMSVAVTSGAGTLAGAPTRSANGPTSLGQWRLGTVAGTNSLTVTAGTLPPLTIVVTGTPDAPSQLAIAGGTGQSAPANTPLLFPVVVRVGDRFGNGVPGAAVSVQVELGGGALGQGIAQVTGADGTITAPVWTLGRTAAPQRLHFTSGALTVNLDATVATGFAPDIRFFGPAVDPTIQQSFIKAAQRLGAMITSDLPDVSVSNFDVATTCAVTGVPPMTEVIDDVVIFATVTPIDGVGRVLGSAGPCIVRTVAQGRLTVIGVMKFDVADLQTLVNDGRIDDVILHEMIHVLGFGTLWSLKGLNINAGTATTAFTGPLAQQGCLTAGGTGTCAVSVPVENTGGPGTADGHWRESVFRTELMTGFVSGVGIPNPLSLITIGSMADLGYTVNMNVNDPYFLASAVAASVRLLRAAAGVPVTVFTEELVFPRAELSGGRMTQLPVRR